MAVKHISNTYRYVGLAGDVKPTGVPFGSTYWAYDTFKLYITYDGDSWAEKTAIVQLETTPTIDIGDVTLLAGTAVVGKVGLVESDGATDAVGEVDSSPTANTILGRLKAIETALAALGYEFSMGGANFNGSSKIKTLWLPSNASTTHDNLQFEGADYVIPSDSVFIGLKISGWIFPGAGQTLAYFGEGLVDGSIVQHVLSFSGGNELAFMLDVIGVFGTSDPGVNKYIKAGTDNANVYLYANSALYGVEVVAT